MKRFIRDIISVMSRKRYYFVSFYADGRIHNAYVVLKQNIRIRMVEDYLSQLMGGSNVIIMNFERISWKQYNEMRDWDDKRKKD